MLFRSMWELGLPKTRNRLKWLICEVLRPRGLHAGTPCTPWCVIGKRSPDRLAHALLGLVVDCLQHQEANGLLASHETPLGSLLSQQAAWVENFGTVAVPRPPWRVVVGNGCMYGLRSPGLLDAGLPMKKGIELMANFDVGAMGLQCRAGVASPRARQSLRKGPVGDRPSDKGDKGSCDSDVEELAPKPIT